MKDLTEQSTGAGSIFAAVAARIRPRSLKGWISVACLLLSAVAVLVFGLGGKGDTTSQYKTASVTRRNLELAISATGTVEPEEVIDVGAQVAGLILSFGTDRDGKVIDYGSVVEEGMILANIDPALYQSDVQQAQAVVARSKADLQQLRAKFTQAELDWKRAQKLGPSDALSQSAFDGYRAAFLAAQASVAVGEAEITQADAALFKANRNLGYCVIKSPVKGVIIDKRVNVGQTVVSSLNAPSLFLIAKDLTRMQVWVSVNEADIGSVHSGQKVTFTVDAFPGSEFIGVVGKVRLNASMSQNVVTYVVEVNTDNTSGKLLPYLTANARFEVGKRENILTVPSAALRWTPNREAGPKDAPGSNSPEAGKGTLWLTTGDEPLRSVAVKVGLSDGVTTEVEGADIKEGDLVVVGIESASSAANKKTTNPFAPQIAPRGMRR